MELSLLKKNLLVLCCVLVSTFAQAQKQYDASSVTTGMAVDTEIFKDGILSGLQEGVTKEQIANMDNPFFKQIATDMLNGTYDFTYRLQSYECLENIDFPATEWLCESNYDRFQGVTGIMLKPGNVAVAVEGIPTGQSVNLYMVTWYAYNSGPTYSKVALKNGINAINCTKECLAYVDYLSDKPESQPAIKVHIIGGIQNGFITKDISNPEIEQKLLVAPYPTIDVVGDKVHNVLETSALLNYTKGKYQRWINVVDSLAFWIHRLAGLEKYKRVKRNKILAYEDFTLSSYMYKGYLGVGYVQGTMKELANPDVLIKTDAVWGPSHEMGHMHQLTPYLTWAGMTEVSNNFFSMFNELRMGYDYDNVENEWATARNIFVKGNKLGGTKSSYRQLGYEARNLYKSNAKMYAAFEAMENATITYHSKDALHAAHMMESDLVQYTFYVMLHYYMRDHHGLRDFLPDLYESLRQTDTLTDKYSLIASAQNGHSDNCKKLYSLYPNSCWVKDKFVTTSSTIWQNSVPYILNFIWKASKISGFNMFPFFEQWGLLRQVALCTKSDYGTKYICMTSDMYDEFKADMDSLEAIGELKPMTQQMMTDFSNQEVTQFTKTHPNFGTDDNTIPTGKVYINYFNNDKSLCLHTDTLKSKNELTLTDYCSEGSNNGFSYNIVYDGPVKLSTATDFATYYNLCINGKYLYFDAAKTDGSYIHTSDTPENSNNYKWAFVGYPGHVALVNKAEPSKCITLESDDLLLTDGLEGTWNICPHTDGGFALVNANDNGEERHALHLGDNGFIESYLGSDYASEESRSNAIRAQVASTATTDYTLGNQLTVDDLVAGTRIILQNATSIKSNQSNPQLTPIDELYLGNTVVTGQSSYGGAKNIAVRNYAATLDESNVYELVAGPTKKIPTDSYHLTAMQEAKGFYLKNIATGMYVSNSSLGLTADSTKAMSFCIVNANIWAHGYKGTNTNANSILFIFTASNTTYSFGPNWNNGTTVIRSTDYFPWNAFKAINTKKSLDNGYYFISNESQKVTKANSQPAYLYAKSKENLLWTPALSANNPSYIFKVTQNEDGTYNIQNFRYQTYLQSGGTSGLVTLNHDAKVKLEISEETNDYTLYNIRSASSNYNFFLNYSTTETRRTVSDNKEDCSADGWIFTRVDNSVIDELNAQDFADYEAGEQLKPAEVVPGVRFLLQDGTQAYKSDAEIGAKVNPIKSVYLGNTVKPCYWSNYGNAIETIAYSTLTTANVYELVEGPTMTITTNSAFTTRTTQPSYYIRNVATGLYIGNSSSPFVESIDKAVNFCVVSASIWARGYKGNNTNSRSILFLHYDGKGFASDNIWNFGPCWNYGTTVYKTGEYFPWNAMKAINLDKPDGIQTPVVTGQQGKNDNVTYDLQGRRISHPSKGIYIRNGKKFIVR